MVEWLSGGRRMQKLNDQVAQLEISLMEAEDRASDATARMSSLETEIASLKQKLAEVANLPARLEDLTQRTADQDTRHVELSSTNGMLDDRLKKLGDLIEQEVEEKMAMQMSLSKASRRIDDQAKELLMLGKALLERIELYERRDTGIRKTEARTDRWLDEN